MPEFDSFSQMGGGLANLTEDHSDIRDENPLAEQNGSWAKQNQAATKPSKKEARSWAKQNQVATKPSKQSPE